jgi:hypothetical protein
VYLPIGLGVLVLGVALTGVLPHQATLPLVLLLTWDAAGIGMIVERRRRKVRLPVPASVVVGAVALAALVLTGTVLGWMGTDRLAASDGPPMVVIGGFLLLVACFAPVFRLVDAGLRFAGRRLIQPRTQPARARRRPPDRKAA